MTTTATQPAKKSIWKNKWTWIIIGAVLLVGIISSIINPTPTVAIPDVAGKTAAEATAELEAAGFKVSLSEALASVTPDNYDAEGTDPAAGESAAENSLVKLQVTEATERIQAAKVAAEAEEQAEAEKAAAESEARQAEYAATPLEIVEAQSFCTQYADTQFPYGVKVHTVLGKLAEEKTDTGWYLKFEATITNAFDADRASNIECHMSGTNGAPSMDSFVAY